MLKFLSHLDPESRGAMGGELVFFFSVPHKLEHGDMSLLKTLCTNLLKEEKAKRV